MPVGILAWFRDCNIFRLAWLRHDAKMVSTRRRVTLCGDADEAPHAPEWLLVHDQGNDFAPAATVEDTSRHGTVECVLGLVDRYAGPWGAHIALYHRADLARKTPCGG